MPPSNLAALPTLLCLLNQQNVPWAWGPHTLVGLTATLGLLRSGMEGSQSMPELGASAQQLPTRECQPLERVSAPSSAALGQ